MIIMLYITWSNVTEKPLNLDSLRALLKICETLFTLPMGLFISLKPRKQKS
jgi:hypothetical protein